MIPPLALPSKTIFVHANIDKPNRPTLVVEAKQERATIYRHIYIFKTFVMNLGTPVGVPDTSTETAPYCKYSFLSQRPIHVQTPFSLHSSGDSSTLDASIYQQNAANKLQYLSTIQPRLFTWNM